MPFLARLSDGYVSLSSPTALERWWVQIPAALRRYSTTLSAACIDGIYLTAWPRFAVLLPACAFVFGVVEGVTHWSFLTIGEGTVSSSVSAVAFAQMLPLLLIAVALGALSANLGLMLVMGYAIGDFLFPGSPLHVQNGFLEFFSLRIPQLLSYVLFLMLAVLPALSTKHLLAGLESRAQRAGVIWNLVRTAASAVVLGAFVLAWVFVAPMVIRTWWAWNGYTPPITVGYFREVVDPWLAGIAVIAVLGRGWLMERASRVKSVDAYVQRLQSSFATADKNPAITRRLGSWGRAILRALLVTLLCSGLMASILYGLAFFITVSVMLVVWASFLPQLEWWRKWTQLLQKVPTLIRLIAVVVSSYFIASFVLRLPGQAASSNGRPGHFEAELIIIVLALLVAAVLLPDQSTASTQSKPVKPQNAVSGDRPVRGGAGRTALRVVVVVMLATLNAYANCSDPSCCFGSNALTVLFIVGLLLLIVAIVFVPLIAPEITAGALSGAIDAAAAANSAASTAAAAAGADALAADAIGTTASAAGTAAAEDAAIAARAATAAAEQAGQAAGLLSDASAALEAGQPGQAIALANQAIEAATAAQNAAADAAAALADTAQSLGAQAGPAITETLEPLVNSNPAMAQEIVNELADSPQGVQALQAALNNVNQALQEIGTTGQATTIRTLQQIQALLQGALP